MVPRSSSYAALAVWLMVGAATAQEPVARVARWQADARAVFLLMFDDGWPSHWQVAAPELRKRGKGEFTKFARTWAEDVWRWGMVYGNHTMTHRGAADFATAKREVDECSRAILKMVPGKERRLLSWGMPGVPTWNVTKEEMRQLLADNLLIDRPPFTGHGAVYHLKTTAEMLALADKAIAARGMEYLVIHGVERIEPKWGYQDFWPLKQDVFLPLLDGLRERRDRGDLWITDHLSYHQYEREREGATLKVLEASNARLRLELTSTADAELYDLPLTVVARVPTGWRQAVVTQGEQRQTAAVEDGRVRFRALPGGGEIVLVAE